ncbi:MAG: hypothetical protein IIB56_06775 [Planctomycetes bacterium]|nr:hypothetical protein [Planctomycetota bacterium]
MKSIRVLCLVLALMLVANGADVNAKSKSGKTPIELAKGTGNKEIIELLQKHGAKE